MSGDNFDLMYFTKGALSGGICCSITHGAMCPVDVVKTRLQLTPEKYNGLMDCVRQTKAEGALLDGLGATVAGYFVQGWFKFGGVELFKVKAAQTLGDEKAWQYRTFIYLAAAACAEFIADIFLCPLESVRIRTVAAAKGGAGSKSFVGTFQRILNQDGVVKGFYSGFGPMLFKQIPYTMAKFTVQGAAAEMITNSAGIDLTKASEKTKMAVALSSGTIAGVAAAIISHPADSLLSMINKSETAGGTGSIPSRLVNLAKEAGFQKLCFNGLAARCIMIGTLTAGQFAIFDLVMGVTGAKKFHFHEPKPKQQ